MAVFTILEQADIADFLSAYDVGKLESYAAISEGIENTNYFVDTQKNGMRQSWVLTLFENLHDDELPYFSELTRFLAEKSFKVPAPEACKTGQTILTVRDRKAVLVPKLRGRAKEHPDAQACHQVGCWLAEMHLALRSFSGRRPLVRDTAWMKMQNDRLEPYMPSTEFIVLQKYIERYHIYRERLDKCPQGTVHGDLFRDNVLFEQGDISGVIDFYHACDATLLFDLAVVANDWCVDQHGYVQERLSALVGSYQTIRTWTEAEKGSWANCLELAALRFWISRLVSKYVPGYQHGSVQGETIKDPDEMKRLLPEL